MLIFLFIIIQIFFNRSNQFNLNETNKLIQNQLNYQYTQINNTNIIIKSNLPNEIYYSTLNKKENYILFISKKDYSNINDINIIFPSLFKHEIKIYYNENEIKIIFKPTGIHPFIINQKKFNIIIDNNKEKMNIEFIFHENNNTVFIISITFTSIFTFIMLITVYYLKYKSIMNNMKNNIETIKYSLFWIFFIILYVCFIGMIPMIVVFLFYPFTPVLIGLICGIIITSFYYTIEPEKQKSSKIDPGSEDNDDVVDIDIKITTMNRTISLAVYNNTSTSRGYGIIFKIFAFSFIPIVIFCCLIYIPDLLNTNIIFKSQILLVIFCYNLFINLCYSLLCCIIFCVYLIYISISECKKTTKNIKEIRI